MVSEKVDLIISDNRYGLYHATIPCFFITHQCTIQIPQSIWLQTLVNRINLSFINRFDTCLIPDFDDALLSGALSKSTSFKNLLFLGPLSRFEYEASTKKNYDLLILLSGPEPQRSLFENLLLQQLINTTLHVLVVRGLPGDLQESESMKNVAIKNHLPTKKLQDL